MLLLLLLLLQGHHCCELDVPDQPAIYSPSAARTPKTPNSSTPGHHPPDADDDIEYILPAQFLIGNPRWHSSLGGSLARRVHPAAAAQESSRPTHEAGSQSRGVSLDWPGRLPGSTWRKSVEVPAAASGMKPAGMQTTAAAGAGTGATAAAAATAATNAGSEAGKFAAADAAAAVTVRSTASVGECLSMVAGFSSQSSESLAVSPLALKLQLTSSTHWKLFCPCVSYRRTRTGPKGPESSIVGTHPHSTMLLWH
jgi:hypothetical protein